MHPLIRIVCLVVLAALAPWLPPLTLLVAAIALLAWGAAHAETGRSMWRSLRRVRWLLLSIAFLYLWFTPGQALLPALGLYSPTQAGALLAAERVGVLLVMVWAAVALLAATPPAELVQAVRVLLAWPFPTQAGQRFANRIGLLLAEMPQVEQDVRDSLRTAPGAGFPQRAALLFARIESAAVSAEDHDLPSIRLAPVPSLQWLLPLSMLLSGVGLMFVNG